jgi:Sec-independent protein translocase protein TatA
VTLLAASPSVFDQPGTLGFLVVFGMGVVLYFVFRSMARHLRKIRDAARQEAAEAETADKGLAASANAADKPQR